MPTDDASILPKGATTLATGKLLQYRPEVFAGAKFRSASDKAISALGIPQLHNEFGAGIKVAIVDSGIDEQAADLRGPRNAVASYRADGHAVFNDEIGHGTMCARLIQGSGTGDDDCQGSAPASELIEVRLPGPTIRARDLAAGLAHIVRLPNAHPLIVCLALEVGIDSANLYRIPTFVDQLQASGALVVAAVGNSHDQRDQSCDSDELVYPSRQQGVLAVAGWDRSHNRMFGPSNRGGSDPGVRSPDLSGPIFPDTPTPCSTGWLQSENGWETSGACALIAGLAAAVWSRSPGSTAEAVKSAIIGSCRKPEPEISRGCVGAGLPDYGRAVTMLRMPPIG